MSLSLLKMFTWDWVCVHYQKSNPYYQGRQSKSFFFFSELCPFSTYKHPTAERWHLHAVLMIFHVFKRFLFWGPSNMGLSDKEIKQLYLSIKDVSHVIQVSRLFLLVKLDPVMETYHLIGINLTNKDMLKPATVICRTMARIDLEPNFSQLVLKRCPRRTSITCKITHSLIHHFETFPNS